MRERGGEGEAEGEAEGEREMRFVFNYHFCSFCSSGCIISYLESYPGLPSQSIPILDRANRVEDRSQTLALLSVFV